MKKERKKEKKMIPESSPREKKQKLNQRILTVVTSLYRIMKRKGNLKIYQQVYKISDTPRERITNSSDRYLCSRCGVPIEEHILIISPPTMKAIRRYGYVLAYHLECIEEKAATQKLNYIKLQIHYMKNKIKRTLPFVHRAKKKNPRKN